MKAILIVSLFGEILNVNSRVFKIANAFSTKTTFVTPDYSHGEKRYKNLVATENNLFSIEFLHVPAYKTNLSIKRIYSHLVFAFKLKAYLKQLKEKPDIIICLMPTSSAAYVCGKYCRRHNVNFVIDVIDLWPDSLIPISKRKELLKMVLLPWYVLTKKAYKMATYISGESREYASVAHRINPNVPWSYTYLGANQTQTQELVRQSALNLSRPNAEIVLCYGGSLGVSYDFPTILNAVKHIHDMGINYKMFFVGEGEKRNFIEEYSLKHCLNITITGRVNYPDFLKYLSVCDIGFNAFKKETKVVHSYKFNDYVASGLFIFNNLPGETADMIENYKIGLNYNEHTLAEQLLNVCQNWNDYDLYRNNLELLIKEELDSDTIYKKLVNNITLSTTQ